MGHGCFLRFLNCTDDTKSSNASQSKTKIFLTFFLRYRKDIGKSKILHIYFEYFKNARSRSSNKISPGIKVRN